MLWLIAATDSTSAAQTDSDLPFISADQSLVVDGSNHPLLPVPLWLMWSYALGLTVTRMRLSIPRYRAFARPAIRPIEQAANPSSRPQFAENWRHPIRLPAIESIQMLRSNTTGVAERDFALLCMGDGVRNTPPGDLFTVRFTTSFTPTANAWTASGAITFDDVLMQGHYSIVGMDGGATGGVAARLIPVGQPMVGNVPAARPGIIWPTSLGQQGTRYNRWGYLGEFVRFLNVQPPQLEVLFTAATANPEGYFDLVKLD
jgi:hypothetical protein